MRKIPNNELDRLTIDQFKEAEKESIIVVLDNIRSLNNIGSVFRTADAFKLQAIYLCGITAKPPHREIYKTALGATESVDWKYFNCIADAIKKLKEINFKVFAVEQIENSISLPDFKCKKDDKVAVIMGNEINGVSEEALSLIDGSIEIPQYGTKHSLNISVCSGIVIWDLFTKKNQKL